MREAWECRRRSEAWVAQPAGDRLCEHGGRELFTFPGPSLSLHPSLSCESMEGDHCHLGGSQSFPALY